MTQNDRGHDMKNIRFVADFFLFYWLKIVVNLNLGAYSRQRLIAIEKQVMNVNPNKFKIRYVNISE